MSARLPVALHVFVIHDGKVLMLKRQNTGTNDGYWSVPAGRLSEGESVRDGVVREALEEVGIRINRADLNGPLVMHHHNDMGERIYFFFKTEKWEGKPQNCEPAKCSAVEWHDMHDPSLDILPHVQKAYDLMMEKSCFHEYGFSE